MRRRRRHGRRPRRRRRGGAGAARLASKQGRARNKGRHCSASGRAKTAIRQASCNMGNFFSSEDAAVDRELSALSPVASFELDVRIAARRGSTPSTHRLRINSTTPLSELVRNVAAIACRTSQSCTTKSLKLAYVGQNGLAVPLDTDESFCRAKLHAMNCCSTLLITCDEDTPTGTAGSNHEDNTGFRRGWR